MLELFAEHVARARGADRPAAFWQPPIDVTVKPF